MLGQLHRLLRVINGHPVLPNIEDALQMHLPIVSCHITDLHFRARLRIELDECSLIAQESRTINAPVLVSNSGPPDHEDDSSGFL